MISNNIDVFLTHIFNIRTLVKTVTTTAALKVKPINYLRY